MADELNIVRSAAVIGDNSIANLELGKLVGAGGARLRHVSSMDPLAYVVKP